MDMHMASLFRQMHVYTFDERMATQRYCVSETLPLVGTRIY